MKSPRSGFWALLTAVSLVLGGSSQVWAQDGSEEPTEASEGEGFAPGQIVALDKRERAPFGGMLISQPDLVRWRLEIERLQFELDEQEERWGRILDVKLNLAETKLRLERERSELREKLWQQRAEQLRQELNDARKAAEPNLWENPIIWFGAGVLVTVLAGVGLGLAL